MTLKQLPQQFILRKLTVIQPSDLMGNYFLIFIIIFIISQQVVHTQSKPFQVSWVRSILNHKHEENLNRIDNNPEIIHSGTLKWQKP